MIKALCGLLLGVLVLGYFESYKPPDIRTTTEVAINLQPSSPAFSRAEISCLSRVIYNESRNQSELGQTLVGAVVINRSISAKFRDTDLCRIAGQRNQFANSQPMPRNVLDVRSLRVAERIARQLSEGHYLTLEPKYRSLLFFNSSGPRSNSIKIGDHHFS